MNASSTNRIERFLKAGVLVRLLSLLPTALLPFTLPEVWRQSVTIGVTLRYWNRWVFENGYAGKFLPAVLDAFDGSGIMPMEAPILNVVFAPIFALGPYYGKIAAVIAITLLQFGLLFAAHRIWKPRFGWSLLLLPFLSFTFGWFGKFTPDLVSMLMTLIGVGLLVNREPRSRNRSVAAILIGLGILMKPTAIAVLPLLLLGLPITASRFETKLIETVKRFWAPIAIPVAIAVAYYLFANPWIDRFRDTPAQFPVSFRDPWATILGITDHPLAYFHVFHVRLFAPYLIYPVAILGFIRWAEARRATSEREFKRENEWRTIGGVFALQLVILTFLSGTHVFDHEYYFMALGPIASLAFARVLAPNGSSLFDREQGAVTRFFVGLIMLLVLVPNLEAVWISYKPLIRNSAELHLAAECRDLIQSNPSAPFRKGVAFRSTPGPYTDLGICFGEREMSATAEWGFLRKEDSDLPGCETVDHRSMVRLVRCKSR